MFHDGLDAQYAFILTITKKIFTWPLLKHPFLLFISVVPFCDVLNQFASSFEQENKMGIWG